MRWNGWNVSHCPTSCFDANGEVIGVDSDACDARLRFPIGTADSTIRFAPRYVFATRFTSAAVTAIVSVMSLAYHDGSSW